MKTKTLGQLLIPIMIGTSLCAQDFNEVLRTSASDAEMGENFGKTVSISGNIAIVGSYHDSEDETGVDSLYYAGSAYFFERDEHGNWHEIQKIVASDRSVYDLFGLFVSISGNYAIVGVPWSDLDATGKNLLNSAGSAYIFERNGSGTWNEVQKIVASDRAANDFFGGSVAVSGSYAIIGANYEDEDASGNGTLINAGSAYIFEREDNGNWNQVQKIIAADRHNEDEFGMSVGISGDYAIVGAYYEDEDASDINTIECAGSAYIFERNGSGIWNEVQKIVASDRSMYDLFGNSVDISGEYIIVGAMSEEEDDEGDDTRVSAGSAYIFEPNGTGTWQEVQKIVASDRAEYDLFGIDVAISGDIAIVGAYNEDENDAGENRLQNAGSAYIFRRDKERTWSQSQKIVASDREVDYFFGVSVDISCNYVIAGTNYNGILPGSIYLFESCEPSTENDPENILENGDFGSCTLTPWFTSINSLVGASATTSMVDGTCMLSDFVISNDPYSWHIQLMQPFTAEQLAKLIPGSDYTLSFEAYSLMNARPCNVFFGLNSDPWTDLINQIIEISDEPEGYSFDFHYPSSFSSLALSFGLGSDTTSVIFDNIKLKRKVFDKDNDGIEDLYDNCADTANTDQTDADNDAIGDICDNCPLHANIDQADADQNGIGDACESNQTAVEYNTAKNSFLVYPNPTFDVINISSDNPATITLFNILGVPVKIYTTPTTEIRIPVHDLPDGLYVLEISTAQNRSIQRIIVQHLKTNK